MVVVAVALHSAEARTAVTSARAASEIRYAGWSSTWRKQWHMAALEILRPSREDPQTRK